MEFCNFDYRLHRLDLELYEILNTCFTKIQMLVPSGYEYWYVSNFEKGPSKSKWYRAESSDERKAVKLVELNVMGITKTTIDKFQYLHYLQKKSKSITWFDFAYASIRSHRYVLFPSDVYSCLRVDFEIREAKTDTTTVVNAAMQVKMIRKNDSLNWMPFKTYHGKSTRPLKKTRQPKNEKEIMEKEAKKAAMIECFKERFGFDKFDDWCLDELGRPIEIEKHFELLLLNS